MFLFKLNKSIYIINNHIFIFIYILFIYFFTFKYWIFNFSTDQYILEDIVQGRFWFEIRREKLRIFVLEISILDLDIPIL